MEALKPKYTFNPVLQRFYQCVEKRALDKTAKIEELDPVIASYINPDERVHKRAAAAFKALETAFPLHKVVEEKKKAKRHWRDYMDGPVELTEEMQAAKKHKTDGGKGELVAVPTKLDDITKKVVDKVSTVDPINDFKSMLSRRDDARVIARAIEGMVEVIKTLVRDSFADHGFPKAIDCLTALRAGCVQMDEYKLFNTALADLKTAFQKRKENFWKMVTERTITLIDSTEVHDSNVKPDDARKFHSGSASVSIPSVSLPSNTSDNLFEEME